MSGKCETMPGHACRDSKMLADNAAALHLLQYPECGGVHTWPCSGDHWHMGHVSREVGEECKTRHADYHRGVPRDSGTLPVST